MRLLLFIFFALSCQGKVLSQVKEDKKAEPIFYLNPKWSPDEKQIVFTSNKEGKLAIYTINKQGEDLRRITALDHDCGLPAWSPDGKNLVYHKVLDGGLLKLFRFSFADNKEVQLTKNSSIDYAACWSDENKIVFNSRKNVQDLNHDIIICDADGNFFKKITDSKYDYSAPAWSPGGKKIVCIRSSAITKPFQSMSAQELQAVRNSAEIILMNVDGSDIRNLSNDTLPNKAPCFSKDANTVYYMTQAGSKFIINKVNIESHEVKEMLVLAGMTNNFSVSPSGKFIVYGSKRDDGYGIYVWDMDKQTERKLIDN